MVVNIAQIWNAVKARKWLLILILFLTVAGTMTVSMMLPKTYTAIADVVLNTAAADPVEGTVLPPVMMSTYISTQLDIIRSHRVAVKVVRDLGLHNNPDVRAQFVKETGGRGDITDWLADVLRRHLEVWPSRDSTVIAISYSGVDPRFTASVANAFAKAYLATSLEMKVDPARENTAWLNEQLKGLRDNLERAQASLSKFQRENGFTGTDDRWDVEMAALAELSTQLNSARGQTYDVLSRARESGGTVNTNEFMSEVLSSGLIQQLKANITQTEAKIMDLSEKVGERHPKYLRAKEELEILKARLDRETKAVARSIKSNADIAKEREGSLRAAMRAQRDKVLAMKRQRDQMGVLQRDVENAQRAYDFALQRATQTTLQSQVGNTNLTLLNEAVPPMQPSRPNLKMNAVLSTLVGSMLALCAVLLAEHGNRKVRAPIDLERNLDVPVLGTLERLMPRGSERKRLLGPMRRPALAAVQGT